MKTTILTIAFIIPFALNIWALFIMEHTQRALTDLEEFNASLMREILRLDEELIKTRRVKNDFSISD